MYLEISPLLELLTYSVIPFKGGNILEDRRRLRKVLIHGNDVS